MQPYSEWFELFLNIYVPVTIGILPPIVNDWTAILAVWQWAFVSWILDLDLEPELQIYPLSPGWHQAIIWTNDGILLIRNFRTKLSETFSEIHEFSFKKMYLKMSPAKWRQFCPGLNLLKSFQMYHCCMLMYPGVDL